MRRAANGATICRAFFGVTASTMFPLPEEEEAMPRIEFAFSARHAFNLA